MAVAGDSVTVEEIKEAMGALKLEKLNHMTVLTSQIAGAISPLVVQHLLKPIPKDTKDIVHFFYVIEDFQGGFDWDSVKSSLERPEPDFKHFRNP
eukprot:4476924-Alexandrium_andersonii.AAC.1